MPSLKETSIRYFEYNVAEMDEILTPDFIGRHPRNEHTRDLAGHKKFWADRARPNVTILHQVEEDDLVAVRVKMGDFEITQFQRFEDGKIVEIWEMYSAPQADEK